MSILHIRHTIESITDKNQVQNRIPYYISFRKHYFIILQQHVTPIFDENFQLLFKAVFLHF